MGVRRFLGGTATEGTQGVLRIPVEAGAPRMRSAGSPGWVIQAVRIGRRKRQMPPGAYVGRPRCPSRDLSQRVAKMVLR
jgi:hypothetical protein